MVYKYVFVLGINPNIFILLFPYDHVILLTNGATVLLLITETPLV